MKPKLKICGMKYNVQEVALLQPDYLGFIFYGPSPRNFTGPLPVVPSSIQKVGVFVNESMENVINKVTAHNLQIVQLHGEESPTYIETLKSRLAIETWKVFHVGTAFDFKKLLPFEGVTDKFLFDTLGRYKGGNGTSFDWNVLLNYPSTTPVIISGGIGLEEWPELKKCIQYSLLPIHAIDVNSKFELKPGLKNTTTLKQLIHEL